MTDPLVAACPACGGFVWWKRADLLEFSFETTPWQLSQVIELLGWRTEVRACSDCMSLGLEPGVVMCSPPYEGM